METILRNMARLVITLLRNVFNYITQKMYEKNVEKNPSALVHVPGQYINQEV